MKSKNQVEPVPGKKRPKRRTNITISESIYAKAQELMHLRDFDDFSGFLEQLIREEHERRMPGTDK